MKVTINEDDCAGCDMCNSISGGVVRVGVNGKAGLNPQANLGDIATLEAIKMTAQVCPQQAIVITEDA